ILIMMLSPGILPRPGSKTVSFRWARPGSRVPRRGAFAAQDSGGRVMYLAVAGFELALDEAGDQLHGEEIPHAIELAVLRELAEVRERHPAAQFLDALVSHLAVSNEAGVALEDGLGEQFAARDPDAELPLQAEDDVQKVDRLGAQVALERGR